MNNPTAIEEAVAQKNTVLVDRILRARRDAELMPDCSYERALVKAVMLNDLPTVRALVREGTPTGLTGTSVCRGDRYLPFHVAVERKHDTIVDYMLEEAASRVSEKKKVEPVAPKKQQTKGQCVIS